MNIKENFSEYQNCLLCPRLCGTDRNLKKGFCGETSILSIDAALLHHGEEPPISFKNGSGAIFFTGCSLRCPFCQNMQISQNASEKKYYSTKKFIGLIKDLIEKKSENINFVTPDHFLPHIIEGVKYLRNNGFMIPTVYNCSGYQSIANLKDAVEYMDIFLFDYKFADKETSDYCVNKIDYPETAMKALNFLYKKLGNLNLDQNGKALKGIIVRHLVIPGFIENSIKAINDLYFNFGTDIYLSLMSQYSPHYLSEGYEKIKRRLTRDEYEQILELAYKLGINGFFQHFIGSDDGYLPNFNDKKNIFKGE